AKGDIAQIEKLIAEGADINAIAHGLTVTALTMASIDSTPATIRKLVELGADIGTKGKDGATPLRFAVQAGKADNVRALIQLGADVMKFDPQVGSLLHVAMWNPSVSVIRELLDAGVNPQRANAAGVTPLNVTQNQLHSLKEIEAKLGGAAPPGVRNVIDTL